MILLQNVTAEELINKHPSLKIMSVDCDGCGSKLFANVPFRNKKYLGLTLPHPKCSCGKCNRNAECVIVICKEEQKSWDEALGSN